MLNKPLPEIKMILLGESGVGKTSIIKRYLDEEFDSNEASSLSMTYVGKDLEINNQKIKLNIWDTIGQEKYRSLSKLFLNETKIVILVYAINAKQSFVELEYWYNLYKEILGPDTILGIAGNKIDLYLNQEVTDEEGKEFADKRGGLFATLTAKESKDSIDRFINNLVKAYLDKNSNNNDNNKDKNVIKLDAENSKNNEATSGGDGCCGGGKKKIRKKKYESILKKNGGYLDSIFLGDNGVGKTSLIKRIEKKEFDKEEKHTDTISESIFEYKNIKLKVYDIDNEKKKSKETIEIITKSKIFFLVYNINDKVSFENIGFWIEAIKKGKEQVKDKESYLLFLIGNKKDKDDKSENKEEEGIVINEGYNQEYIEEGEQLAKKIKGIFRTTSARDNEGLDNIIGEAIENYLNL